MNMKLVKPYVLFAWSTAVQGKWTHGIGKAVSFLEKKIFLRIAARILTSFNSKRALRLPPMTVPMILLIKISKES